MRERWLTDEMCRKSLPFSDPHLRFENGGETTALQVSDVVAAFPGASVESFVVKQFPAQLYPAELR